MQKYSIAISEQDAEDVMAAATGAIVEVLQTVYDYVHEDPSAQPTDPDSMPSPSYDPTSAHSPAAAGQQPMQQATYGDPHCGMQQAMQFPADPSQLYPQQFAQPYDPQQIAAYSGQAAPARFQTVDSPYVHNIGRPIQTFPTGNLYSNTAGQTSTMPTQHQSVQWQQPYADMQPGLQHQSYAPGHMHDVPAATAFPGMQFEPGYAWQYQAMGQYQAAGQYQATGQHQAAGQYQAAGQFQAAPVHTAASTSAPSIEYDRRPRPVEYKPYTQQDYASRNYDAKSQKEYWQLGTLGAQIDDEDLQVLLTASHALCTSDVACKHMSDQGYRQDTAYDK